MANRKCHWGIYNQSKISPETDDQTYDENPIQSETEAITDLSLDL